MNLAYIKSISNLVADILVVSTHVQDRGFPQMLWMEFFLCLKTNNMLRELVASGICYAHVPHLTMFQENLRGSEI